MHEAMLVDIEKDFRKDEFSYDAAIYARYLDRLLAVDTAERTEHMITYYELLHRVLEMIWQSDAPGTTSTSQAQKILRQIQRDWSRKAEPMLRSTMLTSTGLLVPHTGAREWLQEVARNETDPGIRASIERALAACTRSDPIV
jgi:hypothetical protein